VKPLGKKFNQQWERFMSNYSGGSHGGNVRDGDQLILPFDLSLSDIPFPPPSLPKFRFIDLFAGIGGFRMALQKNGGRCVFSSEWDKAAQETYFKNFGEYPFGDIRQFTADTVSDEQLAHLIPDHDLIAGGFPCQPFSNAGVSARNSLGHKHGFECETQGTLFFDLVRIAQVKRPKVLLLENVRNLKSHDGGRTFATIQRTIEEDLGYSFHSAIIDSCTVVPQRRKRCFMVCFRDQRRPIEGEGASYFWTDSRECCLQLRRQP
jgi:DNA (cytosine-5)-methyltransferase 1